MYKEYFGLKEPPFSIAPDPHYLYMSDKHREALAHLLYGIRSDNGFVLLTGDIGAGKTTVCRCLLQKLPENSNIAFILNPKLTVDELLAVICDELGISYPAANTSNKIFVDCINAYLIDANAKGRRTVLIIEEAQNLSPDVLEQIRLLTNLETNERKLLQIIMLGQPELNDILSRPELRQLQQRITARFHLGPLSKQELAAYVIHRLSVAGVDRILFPAATIERLFKLSGGIPRMANLICDRALLGTFVQGKSMVDLHTLNKAALEVLGHGDERTAMKRTMSWVLAGLVLVICGTALATTYLGLQTKYSGAGNDKSPAPPSASSYSNPQSWPSPAAFDYDPALSFQSLFSHWGVPFDAGRDFCRQAETQGLQCMKGLGSLSSITKINRPAVLKLYDDQGREFYLTLSGIKKETATIQSGGETMTTALKEIEKRWLGEYTLLWKAPPHYRGDIYPGMSGSDVQWLDFQLARIQGRIPAAGSHMYNDELVKNLKKFQLAEGLIPDGIAGPLTIIHLNSAAGDSGPRLMK